MNISKISCHGRNFPDLSAADKISFDCIRFQGGVARHRLFERLPLISWSCSFPVILLTNYRRNSILIISVLIFIPPFIRCIIPAYSARLCNCSAVTPECCRYLHKITCLTSMFTASLEFWSSIFVTRMAEDLVRCKLV